MAFSAKQVDAVRHAFHLANFDGQLRTLPVEAEHELIFILPPGEEQTMGDPHCLEIVLSAILDRTILTAGDVGTPTVPFE